MTLVPERNLKMVAVLKILLSSHAFAPSVGGIETVSMILAREWTRAGHSVEITTETEGEDRWDELPVLRSPAKSILRKHIAKADVYFQNHISLRSLVPAFGLKTPVAVLHQTYLWPWNERAGVAGLVKWLVTRRLRNFAISRAVAAALPANTPIVGNPYDTATFRIFPEIEGKKEFIFVGRFVGDKGVSLLLEAMRLLRERSSLARGVRLTLVGSGPEESDLRREAVDLGLTDVVSFTGPLARNALALEYNAHRVLVVPSLWPEPFGIVALEGAACGCRIIGSDQGGLPEAIGPCGVTFPNGDAYVLADRMNRALENSNALDPTAVRAHLAHHEPSAFAQRILELATE